MKLSHLETFMDDYDQHLKKYGYFVIEKVIPEATCKALLGHVISSFPQSQTDFIIKPDFRMHVPLSLTPLVGQSIEKILSPAATVVSEFLSGSQKLVELSSITVFPHAQAQNIHPDEQNKNKQLLSVFVNLVPTTQASGALHIVPGSHLNYKKDHSKEIDQVLELPMGSAVFMNSKTWHGGGANQTVDRIRPIFYFSFGEPNLPGPTYSIRPDVRKLEKELSNFILPTQPAAILWHEKARPTIPEGAFVTSLLRSENTPETTLLLVENCCVTKQVQISSQTPWLLEIMTLVVQSPGKFTLAEISERVGVDLAWLLEFFSYYGVEGWFAAADERVVV